MNRARTIDILLRAGVRLGRDHRGHLLHTPTPIELAPLTDELAATWPHPTEPTGYHGHPWRRCNTCGRQPAADADRCDLAGCKGRPLTYRDPPALELHGQAIGCARPGCQRPACTLTHWHEPLCQSDFHHLALHLNHRSTTA